MEQRAMSSTDDGVPLSAATQGSDNTLDDLLGTYATDSPPTTAKIFTPPSKPRATDGEEGQVRGRARRSPVLRKTDSAQEMARFAVLYSAALLVILPTSLLLASNKVLLTPLFNSLPFALHNTAQYATFGSASILVYHGLGYFGSPAMVISARACFAIMCIASDITAIWGRQLGSLCGELLGPEWGALAATTALGLPAVVSATTFALLCFDLISPIRPAREETAGLWHGVLTTFRAAMYLLHLWLGERVARRVLDSEYMRTVQPEKIILGTSLVLSIFALLANPSHSRPLPQQITTWLQQSRSLPPEHRKLLSRILPARASSVLLVARLPLIFLALRLHASRPLPPYISADGSLRILASERGLTGQVVVADHLQSSYRFLRCDHSLLGGRWIRAAPGLSDPGKQPVIQFGDSIFAAFALQEVALLAARDSTGDGLERTLELTADIELISSAAAVEGSGSETQRALIIGLGVGIAANTLMKRGIEVDVVEIDPLVYRAAIDYLDLSTPATIHLTDGAGHVHELAEQARQGTWNGTRYTYAIQDCFSGGSVPNALFATEFWEDLGEVMRPDGVVIMNFVGHPGGPAAQAVVGTILSVYPQCRAFSDAPYQPENDDQSVNMVVLCAMSYSPLLTFRPPTPADVMRSPLRAHTYSTFLANEILLDAIVGVEEPTLLDRSMILTEDNPLKDEWQIPLALAVWRAMQKILTPHQWLTY